MPFGTACGIFTRIRYSTENDDNTIILSKTVQDICPTVNKNTWLDKRQNTGDSRDTAQPHRMTLGTACVIFTRIRYSTENDDNAIILSGIQDGHTQGQLPDATDNGEPVTGKTYTRTDEEIPDTRTSTADITTNGSAPEGIDNREIDDWKAIHTSNTAATSKRNGVSQITAQQLRMTPPTACGILNRLGNNEEDAHDNEILTKNTPGVNNSGSKTHPYPEVPPRSIREQEAEHKKAPQAGIGVTFEPKKTREGCVVQQVLKRPHQLITRGYPLDPGTVLFEVDGKPVTDKSPEELTAVLSGPKGSTVSLGLEIDGKNTYVNATRDFDSPRTTSKIQDGWLPPKMVKTKTKPGPTTAERMTRVRRPTLQAGEPRTSR